MKSKLVSRSFFRVIRDNPRADLLLLLSAAGVVAASLLPPQILRRIIDENLVPKKAEGILSLAAMYFGFLVLVGLCDLLKEGILAVLGQRASRRIRMDMMDKMGRIDARYFSAAGSGTVMSRFTNDVDAIETIFTSGVVGMFIDLFKTIGIVVSVWQFSARLGVLALALFPALFVLSRVIQKRMLAAQLENRVFIGWINNHISESVRSIQMIKSFSKEAYMEGKYRALLSGNFGTQDRINFFDSVYPPMIQFIRAAVISAVVLMSSGRLSISGIGLSLGMVAASIELISNLFAPIESLGMELQNIQQSVSGIRRVNEFYDAPEEAPKDPEKTAAAVIPDPSGAVLSFENVSFSYDEETPVLIDISLTVEPGRSVTFIGRTGVGKTTLFRLIMGLMRPTEGRIAINGTNVADIPHAEKRKIFGYVDQEFRLIDGTVADQITLGDPNVTRGMAEAAIEIVGLADYIATLEKGIDTDVKSGTVFSQGQKQLLAIARAVAADPPILLLDEITASLDSETEDQVISALRRVSRNHTVLSISHRLTSMVAADTVVILENGRVRSAGTPEELLETDEWYRKHMALEREVWR